VALVANMVVGALAVVSRQTASIITLSVFGALGLYVVSMLALFALRRREPSLSRPFRAPGYPLVPAVALVLSAVCTAAVAVAYPSTALVFLALMVGGLIAFRYRART
jgi:ethanolamine permease